ncbi:uncharacterized protein E0L32_009965 [Thyridium curvatum]|uniref:C2H2-type domain-containing protein n=1 Tax=Thyridium curvatum TaxID=1093900 RepID=A0A507APH7_9PEZI|nr:uncharacterized protein E0L32_009965 [Thyridium curvatum]TPX08626.1 hypothetical protein E0L32_009965 [Thyridium curvatum]
MPPRKVIPAKRPASDDASSVGTPPRLANARKHPDMPKGAPPCPDLSKSFTKRFETFLCPECPVGAEAAYMFAACGFCWKDSGEPVECSSCAKPPLSGLSKPATLFDFWPDHAAGCPFKSDFWQCQTCKKEFDHPGELEKHHDHDHRIPLLLHSLAGFKRDAMVAREISGPHSASTEITVGEAGPSGCATGDRHTRVTVNYDPTRKRILLWKCGRWDTEAEDDRVYSAAEVLAQLPHLGHRYPELDQTTWHVGKVSLAFVSRMLDEEVEKVLHDIRSLNAMLSTG